jgi:hypothetical protein
MATLTRGKFKGQTKLIHQFCNDWFYMDDGSVVNPTSLSFSTSEIEQIELARKNDQVGVMFKLFKWDGNKLRKVKRP